VRLPNAAALTAVLTVSLGALVACGDQTEEPGAAGGWRTEHLPGKTAVDFPSVLATDGDDALVLVLDDEGVLRSHLSVDGAGFEAGEPLQTGEQWVTLGGAVRLDDGSWYAVGSGGVEIVDGDEEIRYTPIAFRSSDGQVWERVDVRGFPGAVDVNDLAVTPDGVIVAAGSHRTEDAPSMGGFQAHVWTSEDGKSFEQVDLPGVTAYRSYDDESYAAHLVVVGDELLAAGRVESGAALWRSTDGSTWERNDDPLLSEAYSINGLQAVDETVVASVGGLSTQALRSPDGGRTWQESDLPLSEEAEAWAPLWSGGGRFFTLTGIDDMSWSEPEVCYADPDQCGRNPEAMLVSSEDGATWTGVDTDGLGELDQVAGATDGRILVIAGGGGGGPVDIHTWAGGDLPVSDGPATRRPSSWSRCRRARTRRSASGTTRRSTPTAVSTGCSSRTGRGSAPTAVPTSPATRRWSTGSRP